MLFHQDKRLQIHIRSVLGMDKRSYEYSFGKLQSQLYQACVNFA